jgi:hypothetical protein
MITFYAVKKSSCISLILFYETLHFGEISLGKTHMSSKFHFMRSKMCIKVHLSFMHKPTNARVRICSI